MKTAARFQPWATALTPAACLLLLLSLVAPAGAAIEYDFVYVDAFQSDYDLKECYLFDISNEGRGCGLATDLPSYSGYHWSLAAEKSRLSQMRYPRAINEAGQVAGGNQVFDLGSGTTTIMPVAPGAVATPMALDINDLGVVVGYDEICICSNSDRMLQIPFIWDAAHGSRSIPVPGAKELVKVNNANVAVGNIRASTADGFVYEIATGRTILLGSYFPPTQYPSTEAAAINDLGMVTGIRRSDNAQSYHGFVWTEAGGARLLPHLLGRAELDVRPWAINDAGVVVGMAEVANYVFHAFVWDAARGIRDLNSLVTLPPNFILDRALGINDRGWIVGDGHYGPYWSSSQAFVLIPRQESQVAVAPGAVGDLDLRIAPNPAGESVAISYSVERPVAARITVFDLRGRKVAEVLDGETAGGVARWDGRDASGRRLPSGTYLVRLEAEGHAITRRLALVR